MPRSNPLRSIPACAGNRSSRPRRRRCAAVHPRLCGEQSPSGASKIMIDGSSPRVRGTVSCLPRFRPVPRFIPACAGNSRRLPRGWSTCPVHPRVCGEQRSGSQPARMYDGSSPRVRGTAADGEARRALERFIPACAGNSAARITTATAGTVHPRVCGEQGPDQPQGPQHAGSSPRVRGTVADARDADVRRRFIPACAGNRPSPAPDITNETVHPRVCGEQQVFFYGAPSQTGSSPRVRGTVRRHVARKTARRFIPACAGNRRRARRIPPSSSVHPRVCGEQKQLTRSATHGIGSSPRVRGTARLVVAAPGRSRFIPACAGNRPHHAPPDPAAPVHPRVCGEQGSVVGKFAVAAGSSPRVRGTGPQFAHRVRIDRFIPACAGNRQSANRPRAPMTVHPRVCGEQGGPTDAAPLLPGSSPRVRGTADVLAEQLEHVRFIPACAGNRTPTRILRRWSSVHPRVCGEQTFISPNASTMSGSSPRVRGTDPRRLGRSVRVRFIPACAGNRAWIPWSRSRPPVHPRVCGEQAVQSISGASVFGSSPRVRGTGARARC